MRESREKGNQCTYWYSHAVFFWYHFAAYCSLFKKYFKNINTSQLHWLLIDTRMKIYFFTFIFILPSWVDWPFDCRSIGICVPWFIQCIGCFSHIYHSINIDIGLQSKLFHRSWLNFSSFWCMIRLIDWNSRVYLETVQLHSVLNNNVHSTFERFTGMGRSSVVWLYINTWLLAVKHTTLSTIEYIEWLLFFLWHIANVYHYNGMVQR